jgi:G3E family GTPase
MAAEPMDTDGTAIARVPVTVLCGFLGAGKTTLLKYLVEHETGRGRRIAAIVNDVATLNIDGSLVSHAFANTDAGKGGGKGAFKMLTLEGGSVCSTLQDDLTAQLVEVATSGTFDHIFVECSGVTHPVAIFSLFGESTVLAKCVRLHASVTMVDCFNLCRVLLKQGQAGGTVEDALRSI